MIDRSDLWSAGGEALRELGLTNWRIFYTDEEAETMRDRQPAPDSAWNLRFNLVTDDGRFLTLRLRLPTEQVGDSLAVRQNVKTALINRIRHDHVGTPQ
jgi:hypothetical protein